MKTNPEWLDTLTVQEVATALETIARQSTNTVDKYIMNEAATRLRQLAEEQ